ncbi:hypothetical protein HLH34_15235 [Gluconacetobacter azotocaptans]|uniref:Uncharacterized protein n=1 Tax=Gluconacetobacter azotocaptans TaxID=142834 RepID=A0A7W4PHN6_9PROT|nr:hypothetical protein [Gluconacetobacter azotocaptans]MBB2191296.1 hypothetical protein [Gluconacetobacter azotocaptans]MBM9403730.1 hypothetical protein [Gluconacetobacter azotocaptans]GBQ33870.1 hypothetical protein AA13594_2737 [Gluconacetobacter azotocaptans DSM 13594]
MSSDYPRGDQAPAGPRRPMPTPSPGPFNPDDPPPDEVPVDDPIEPDEEDEGPVI